MEFWVSWLGQVDPDRLVLRVVLHDLGSAFAIEPRRLVATERSGCVEHVVGVSLYRSRMQRACHAMASFEIERVYPGRENVIGVIRELDRHLLGAEWAHCQHRQASSQLTLAHEKRSGTWPRGQREY